jgi:YegS/Rv2252/BmrU family lipid kinase
VTTAQASDPGVGTVTVVVNPASAGGATAKRWPAIRDLLDRSGLQYRAQLTQWPGDATEITRRALRDGCTRVVSVGGDGTLNEVVNGFFDAEGRSINPDAALAIVPSGTGGDFRKSLEVNTDAAAAIARLRSGGTRQVDVGRVDFADGSHRFFVNIADCGIGGEVVARVNRSKRKAGGLRGTIVFLWTSLAVLMTYPGCDVVVDVDGVSVTRRLRNVVIANGRYFGGGMKIAPGAQVDNGTFDVVLVGMTSKLGALTGIPGLYKGTHLTRPEVEVMRGKTVRVSTSASTPVLFDLEGEQIGQAPATVTCLPKALTVVV